MPRGISRAKHPEMYSGKPTNVTKLTTAKKTWGKGAQKLGTKGTGTQVESDKFATLTSLTTHLQHLSQIRTTMPTGADISVLSDEIADLTDIIVAERKKLFPNIEEPAPETPAAVQPPVQVAPPAFVPPPAPGIQPHA